MDGIPAKTSPKKRMVDPYLFVVPYSETYTPEKSPIGRPIAEDKATKSKVPCMALPIPPPGVFARGGSWVKKSRLMEDAPLIAMSKRMLTRGTIARPSATTVKPVQSLSDTTRRNFKD